ncbi:MAG: sugar phosphate isomerase/epimerase family protein [Promethearchaeota archaeon]
MKKISLATYSLRQEIRKIGMKGVADFIKELGLEHVEINNMFTKPEKLPGDVKIFENAGIKTILLTVDGNNFFMPDEEEDRQYQFNFMKKWLDAANKSGIEIVRSNMGHTFPGIHPTKEAALADLVATFKPIQEYAESLGITYVFENHGGYSSDVDFQVEFKKHFPTDKVGFLLDTGNYNPKSQVYDNIGKLGSSIKIVHAKTYDFDENGEETQLDFKRIISELKKVGFDGFYSIEFEGKMPARQGIRKTLELLNKYL